MGTCASDLNHIRGANGVDMYHDPLSETPPVFSISSHLFLIEVAMIGGVYMCSRGAETAEMALDSLQSIVKHIVRADPLDNAMWYILLFQFH